MISALLHNLYVCSCRPLKYKVNLLTGTTLPNTLFNSCNIVHVQIKSISEKETFELTTSF